MICLLTPSSVMLIARASDAVTADYDSFFSLSIFAKLSRYNKAKCNSLVTFSVALGRFFFHFGH